MGKSKRTVSLRSLATGADSLKDSRAAALLAFIGIRDAVVTARAAVTQAMFDAYTTAYKVGAWYALAETQIAGKVPSANDMLRVFAGLPSDTPSDSKVLKAEVNFSDYVRNRSTFALDVAGKPSRGAAKVTDETFLKTVTRLVGKVKPGKTKPGTALAIYKAVKDWSDRVTAAHSGAANLPATGTDGK